MLTLTPPADTISTMRNDATTTDRLQDEHGGSQLPVWAQIAIMALILAAGIVLGVTVL